MKWSKKTWAGLKLTVTVALIGTVIYRSGGTRMLDMLTHTQGGWIVASGLCFLLSIVLGAFQWNLLMGIQGIQYSFQKSFSTYYLGMFVNALAFNLAGDAVRIYKLRQEEVTDWTSSFTVTFMDRYMGFCALSLFAILAALGIMARPGPVPPKTAEFLFYSCGALFACFALGSLVLTSRRLGKAFEASLAGFRLRRLKNSFHRMRRCLETYRIAWRQLLLISTVSCGVHFLRILGHWYGAKALSIDISLYFILCFIPITSLVAVIPLNIGGWGLPQGVATALYSLEGVLLSVNEKAPNAAERLAAAGALTFLPSMLFYLVMLGGVFFFWSALPGRQKS